MKPDSQGLPRFNCAWCCSWSWGVHCRRLVNGEARYSLYCKGCDSEHVIQTVDELARLDDRQPRGVVWVIRKYLADSLGVTRESRDVGEAKCAVRYCTSMETELHHFAPRNMFPDDADDWPTAYLCKVHHHLWHERVTPELYRLMQQYRKGRTDDV